MIRIFYRQAGSYSAGYFGTPTPLLRPSPRRAAAGKAQKRAEEFV
jgi:hypothetical protein